MIRAAVLTALLAASAAAQACGVCVEDKMAAVYDHGVIGKALGQKHHVAFFHVDGSLAAGEPTKRLLQKAADATPSVDLYNAPELDRLLGRATPPADLMVSVNMQAANVTEIETTNQKVRIYQIN